MKNIEDKLIAVAVAFKRAGAFIVGHFASEATAELGAYRLMNSFTFHLVLFAKTFLPHLK